MLRPAAIFVVLVALAGPAEARFGKGGSGRGTGSPPSSSGSGSSGRRSSPPSSYHSAQPVPSYRAQPAPPSQGFSTTRYASRPYYRRYRGFGYGYGYSYYYAPPVVVAPAPVPPPTEPLPEAEAVSPIRVSLGIEGQGFIGGANLGVNAMFEGERWGVSLSAADIIVRTDDGTEGFDHIGDFTAHLTFAFLTGQYGRLRLEAGADAFVAPHLITIGPTFGMSGVVWFGGPVGLEGSVNVTPWPFTQLDGKLGLAVGIENWGLRAGWRVQVLNDRGLVDGVAHQDIFNGPYLGLSYVF